MSANLKKELIASTITKLRHADGVVITKEQILDDAFKVVWENAVASASNYLKEEPTVSHMSDELNFLPFCF